jgi:anti-sigma regulatory factor (Ser/Thr protein kinase)
VINTRQNGDQRRGQGGGESGCPDVLWTGSHPTEPNQVAKARQVIEATLADHPRFDAALGVQLVSELATNAIRHSRSDTFGLVVALTPAGLVRVAVSDSGQGPTRPVMRQPEAVEEGGRGLWLVDALAACWGVTKRKSGGYTVWFELTPAEETTAVGSGSHDG